VEENTHFDFMLCDVRVYLFENNNFKIVLKNTTIYSKSN
jgi:hypothetical protein